MMLRGVNGLFGPAMLLLALLFVQALAVDVSKIGRFSHCLAQSACTGTYRFGQHLTIFAPIFTRS